MPLLDLQAGGFLDAVAVPRHILAASRGPLATACTGATVLGFAAGLRGFLAPHWSRLEVLVACMSAGALIRSIAPLLAHKQLDPAVLLLDSSGQRLLPLLGGHAQGADRLATAIAAYRDGDVLFSGYSSSHGHLALDAFGQALGWRRGTGDWDVLMKALARQCPIRVRQDSGATEWQHTPAANRLQLVADAPGNSHHLLYVGHRHVNETTAHWHPPVLWLGLGCERHTSPAVLGAAVQNGLAAADLAHEAVAGVASLDRKGDEPAVLTLCEHRSWPLRLFSAARLSTVAVPNGSAAVAQAVGTPSVAEAAAMAAAGAGATLLVPKLVQRLEGEPGAATVAVAIAARAWAPQRGALHVVGSGPGSPAQLTAAARAALKAASSWVGYGPYLDLLEPLRSPDQQIVASTLGRERERCSEALARACEGQQVALVSSGDSGIYGMAGLALELWHDLPSGERPAFQVHPGISAVQMAAARLGAPLMHDCCTISLSDRLTSWHTIRRRLQAAAAGDFVVALYNPRSQERDWQLQEARQLLLHHRAATTPVAICRQLTRPGETVHLTTLGHLNCSQVDMLSLVVVGNSETRSLGPHLLTPRGYPRP